MGNSDPGAFWLHRDFGGKKFATLGAHVFVSDLLQAIAHNPFSLGECVAQGFIVHTDFGTIREQPAVYGCKVAGRAVWRGQITSKFEVRVVKLQEQARRLF